MPVEFAVPAAIGDVFTRETADAFTQVLQGQQDIETRRQLPVFETFNFATQLALRRAELHGRSVWPLDVEYVLSMWCKWPFKPPPPYQYREFVEERLDPLIVGDDFEGLTREIREPALALSFEAFYAAQQAPNLALLFASG